MELSPTMQFFLVVGGAGPSTAAFALTYREAGIAGMRKLCRRGLLVRFGFREWLLILLLPQVVTIAAAAMFAPYPIGEPPSELLAHPWRIGVYLILFVAGAALEEFGWRGYAQPGWAARLGDLRASIVVGVAWALWHLPLFFIPGLGHAQLSFPAYLTLTVAAAIVIGDLLRRTGGSVAAAVGFHAAMNMSLTVFPPAGNDKSDQRMLWCVAALYVVAAGAVVVRSRLRPAGSLGVT